MQHFQGYMFAVAMSGRVNGCRTPHAKQGVEVPAAAHELAHPVERALDPFIGGTGSFSAACIWVVARGRAMAPLGRLAWGGASNDRRGLALDGALAGRARQSDLGRARLQAVFLVPRGSSGSSP